MLNCIYQGWSNCALASRMQLGSCAKNVNVKKIYGNMSGVKVELSKTELQLYTIHKYVNAAQSEVNFGQPWHILIVFLNGTKF